MSPQSSTRIALATCGTDVEEAAAAMRRIDALYTDRPFYGSRRIAFELDEFRLATVAAH